MEKLAKDEVWYCIKCGYTTDADEPPLRCPLCYAPREDFVKMKRDEITGY